MIGQKHTLSLFCCEALIASCLAVITYTYVVVFLLAHAKKETKIKAELTLGVLAFPLASAQGRCIAAEQRVAGLYPAFCGSYFQQPAIPLPCCAPQSSGSRNNFLHLSLFKKRFTWLVAAIHLDLTSLTRWQGSASSRADDNKEEGGGRPFITYQETSTDILKKIRMQID